MATTQQSQLVIQLVAALQNVADLATAQSNMNYQRKLVIDSGTGANQANQIWSDTRTLTTGANETLDLSGSLTNAFGESVTFTKVKAMIIANKGTTTLTIGNGTNPFLSWVGAAAHTITIPPGGIFVLTAPDANGFAVTAGTGDALKIANSAGASVDYDIVIIGVN